MIVVKRPGASGPLVRVLPVTHSPPEEPDGALELPQVTKQRLGLDSERSWIVLDEANDFIWPGPDLRPAVNGDPASAAYGVLPRGLINVLRTKLLARHHGKRGKIVLRT